MKYRSAVGQRGISILGVTFVIAVLAVGGLLVARVVPTFIEYQGVLRAANKSKDGNTPAEVRVIFDKAAEIENITSIQGKDLDVSKDANGNVVVRFSYDKELPLGGPVSLKIHYEGKSL